MNFIAVSGRLTKDPEIRATQEGMAIARYSLAVDRQTKEKKTDFFNCICFGKAAEFVEKYLRKGMKILIDGSMQQSDYTNKNGQKVIYWELVVNHHEFCEKREDPKPVMEGPKPEQESFMPIPDNLAEELPFTF